MTDKHYFWVFISMYFYFLWGAGVTVPTKRQILSDSMLVRIMYIMLNMIYDDAPGNYYGITPLLPHPEPHPHYNERPTKSLVFGDLSIQHDAGIFTTRTSDSFSNRNPAEPCNTVTHSLCG